jgi:hypothetical protein
VLAYATTPEGNWTKFNSYWATSPSRPRSGTLAANNVFVTLSMTESALSHKLRPGTKTKSPLNGRAIHLEFDRHLHVLAGGFRGKGPVTHVGCHELLEYRVSAKGTRGRGVPV